MPSSAAYTAAMVLLTRGPKCLAMRTDLLMYINIRESVYSKKYIHDSGQVTIVAGRQAGQVAECDSK